MIKTRQPAKTIRMMLGIRPASTQVLILLISFLVFVILDRATHPCAATSRTSEPELDSKHANRFQDPSQSFLSATAIQQTLANGLTNVKTTTLLSDQPRKVGNIEHQDTFLMMESAKRNTESDQTTTQAIPTTTTLVQTTDLPQEPDNSNNDNQDSASLPIDINRQQFLTHDQLTSSNSSSDFSDDQGQNKTSVGMENAQQTKDSQQRAGSFRSIPNRVSHLSSLFSGRYTKLDPRLLID